MSKPAVSNETKATAAGGLIPAVAGYVSVKLGVPLELALMGVMALSGYIARWAAKLLPTTKA